RLALGRRVELHPRGGRSRMANLPPALTALHPVVHMPIFGTVGLHHNHGAVGLPGGTGTPASVGPECVRLFRTGMPIPAIARRLRLSPATVRGHLRRVGAIRSEKVAARRTAFAAAWNAAASLAAAARALGMTQQAARYQATRLRRL